jgi:ATP/maltotriose-dependent transcriptional regulator MalT
MYKFIIVFLLVISCQETKIKDSSIEDLNPIDYNSYSSSHKPNIDSLFHAVSSRPDDTIKVNDLLTIFKLSIRNKPIRYDILEVSGAIAGKINYDTGIANALSAKGVNERYQHDYLKSVILHKKALEYYSNSWDVASYIKNLNNLGVSYRRLNIEEEAIKYYLEALKLTQVPQHIKSKAIALNGIGNAYVTLKKYDDAIKYFKLALNMEELGNSERGIGYNYSNLGEAYMYKKEYDSAFYYHNKSLEIAEKSNNENDKAIIYSSMALMFQHEGEPYKALDYYSKAIPILEQNRSKRLLSFSLINTGIVYQQLDNFEKAEEYIKSGLTISTEIASKENIVLGYEALSELLELKGQFKDGLKEYKLMTAYRDSIFNIQSENNIAAMQIKYDSEKKDEQIQQLHLKNQIQKSSLITQYLAIGLLLLGILFFYLYNRLRLKNKGLEIISMRHKIELYLQQIAQLENNGNFNANAQDDYGLSARETEVLSYIAKGLKNQEIADAMFVSLSTVKTHTKNIFEKLEVRNRIEAVQKSQLV